MSLSPAEVEARPVGDLLSDPHGPAIRDRARLHAALGEPVRLAIAEALVHSDLAPDQVAAALGLPPNALAHHLKVLDETGLVRRLRSAGDGRRRYLSLDHDRLDALSDGVGVLDLLDRRRWTATSVLFVCTANAARSQLAAALWASCSTVPAGSAGSDPAPAVAELTRQVAAAHGLQLADPTPRGYDSVPTAPQLVVSVCDVAREAGTPFDAPRLHWSVPDPMADGSRAAFERTLSTLRRRVTRLAPRVTAPRITAPRVIAPQLGGSGAGAGSSEAR